MDSNAQMAAEKLVKEVCSEQGGAHLNYGSGDPNKVTKSQESGVSKDS